MKGMLSQAYRQHPIELLDIISEVIKESNEQDRAEEAQRHQEAEQATPSSRTLGSSDTWSPEPNYDDLDEIINQDLMLYQSKNSR